MTGIGERGAGKRKQSMLVPSAKLLEPRTKSQEPRESTGRQQKIGQKSQGKGVRGEGLEKVSGNRKGETKPPLLVAVNFEIFLFWV